MIKNISILIVSIVLFSCTGDINNRLNDSFALAVDEEVDDDLNEVFDEIIGEISDEVPDETSDETLDENEAPDEEVIIYCSSNPCKNGGICTDKEDGYDCDCSNTGFSGHNCDLIPGAFVTHWKTYNKGISKNNQITIQGIRNTPYTYNYSIDCDSDGVFEAEHQTGAYTCEYESPGIYTVSIKGQFPRIFFMNTVLEGNSWSGFVLRYQSDNPKLLSVEQWGDIEWKTMASAFNDCVNLKINAIDFPDLSSVKTMEKMFSGALLFNQDIGLWDVSNVTNMKQMFLDAESFNQDLGSWNVSNVDNMYSMLRGVTLSVSNYDSLLSGWSKLNLQNNVIFDAGNNQYCNGNSARNSIISGYGWEILDGGSRFNCD